MGGGTTLIEALRAERKVVGIDLNPIATFVANVKLTKLSKVQIDEIEKEAYFISKTLHYKLKNDQFSNEALSLINYKGLGRKEIFNLKAIIKGTSLYLKKVKEIKDKKVKNFLKLLILRCLHSTLHDKRPIADFHVFKQKIRSNSLDMLEGMSSLDKYLVNSRNKFSIYSKSSLKTHKTKELKSKKISSEIRDIYQMKKVFVRNHNYKISRNKLKQINTLGDKIFKSNIEEIKNYL